MPRRKPTAVVIADLKQAEAALGELARLERELTAVECALNEGIDRLKAEAAAAAKPLGARRKELEAALATFAQLNKSELFGRRKSRELAFGVIGFRRSTKLVTRPRLTLALVLEKLREYGFREAIRTRESVDKEAMRDWPDERLELVGMRRKVADEFFIELKTEDIDE